MRVEARRRRGVGTSTSAEKQLASNRKAPRDGEIEAATRQLRDPRNCTFPEPSLFQDGENSFSFFFPTLPPTPRPPSAFLRPPSWSRSLSSIDFSQQPSSPAVDSAPASFKFHSVIFVFGDFVPLRLCLFMTVVLRGR